MHVFICVDDRMGLTFNGRRQSRDRLLRKEILNLCSGQPLLISPFSADQFRKEDPQAYQVLEDPLAAAGEDAFCFCEDLALAPWQDRIQTLTLCRWNRAYPGDCFLDLDLSGWKLLSARDIPGSSHELITLEVYTR